MREKLEEAADLIVSGRTAEARDLCERLLEGGRDPDKCLMMMGSCLLLAEPARAALAFSMVPDPSPLKIHALVNEGIARALAGDPRASDILESSLRRISRPESFAIGRLTYRTSRCQAHFAAAQHLQKRTDDNAAMVHLEECLRRPEEMAWSGINPDHVKLDLAYCRMREGMFDARSWELHEGRWFKIPKSFDPPCVSGNPENKTALVYAEQGYGDNIQFVRFARNLKERGARVVLLTHPALKELFARMPFVDQVVLPGEPLPEHQLRVPIMSLPHLLGIGDDVGCPTYIHPDQGKIMEFRRLLPEGPSVGIAWRGNPRSLAHPESRKASSERNLPLPQLIECVSGLGLRIVSLQLDGHDELEGLEVHDPMGHVRDYHDTAAIVAGLDFVVSADTSVAHLAAAMGKTTIVPDRKGGDWRWGKDAGMAKRWYPSMEMFRQEERGDWAAPLRRARARLAAQKNSLGVLRDAATTFYSSENATPKNTT